MNHIDPEDAMTGTEWRDYHAKNHRSTRIAELWVRDIVHHLRSHPRLGRASTVLDFGCGYFDAGIAIADRVMRIDGMDVDEYSCRRARSRAAQFPATVIHGSTDELPREAYDLIFANSVFQYLGGDAGIAATLRLFHTLLKPNGLGEVLVVDLLPPKYSSVRDAFRSLWVAARNGILATMVRFLGTAALQPGMIHRIGFGRFAELAGEAGFDCTKLATNLTPSRQRYTCKLRIGD